MDASTNTETKVNLKPYWNTVQGRAIFLPERGEMKLNGLDLFSGIGGISIALSEWVRTIAYCENDRYAQAVLLSRMGEGKIDRAPIWDNVQTLTGDMLPEIDIIFGGFPCQDISVAGNGIGLEGERSGLFFEIVRLVGECRPAFVFLENVPAITIRGLDRVLMEFTALGYDCRWTIVSAAEVGANHLRERWFLLAYSNNSRGRKEQIKEQRSENQAIFRNDGKEKSMANSDSLREQPEQKNRQNAFNRISNGCENVYNREGKEWWETEPSVGRVVNGLQYRSLRLKCLGNAVVPIQAKEAFERLVGLKWQ